MSRNREFDWTFADLNQPIETRFRNLTGRNWASTHGPNLRDGFEDFFRDPDRHFRGFEDNKPVRPTRPATREQPNSANRPNPERVARDVPNKANPNEITSVDMSARANTELHFTSKFDLVRKENILIVRRGHPFTVQISFKNNFDPKSDIIQFIFDLGNEPSVIKGTKQVLDVDNEVLPVKNWGARQKSIQGNRLWVECLAAPNTPIGAWNLSIVVQKSTEEECCSIRRSQSLCYSTLGTVFEENILKCAFLALDASKLPYENRGDPIQVSRAISAVVNSLEDEGVIEGNWSGSYIGGTPPTEWQGSVMIMQRYYKTRKPVKFGQCWVFAGVTTTILRAFGIPARTVSNFNSAHDTNANLSIDEVYNNKMEILESQSTDSIWNFHVWNECWMARPDLPKGMGGWQLLDATPQERSGNMHRCGPVSVKAVRCGNVGLQYDTPFAFAEVNADIVKWIMERSSPKPKFLSKDETRVGQFISCVKPNSTSNMDDDRLDLTEEYKPAEKSAENKAAVLNALNVSNSTSLEAYDWFGDDFTVVLKMTNLINETRTLEISLHLYTVYYTGIIHEKIKSGYFNINLRANQASETKLEIKADDYLGLIKDQCTFHVTCLAVVKETNQVFSSVDDFNVAQPTIQIQVEGGALKLNTPSRITASFVNPLNKTLHKSKWILEGPGIKKPKEIASEDIPTKSPAEFEATITPKDTGNKTILVSFSSLELNDIEGYLHVRVT